MIRLKSFLVSVRMRSNATERCSWKRNTLEIREKFTSRWRIRISDPSSALPLPDQMHQLLAVSFQNGSD